MNTRSRARCEQAGSAGYGFFPTSSPTIIMSDNAFITKIRTNAGTRHLKAALPDAEDVRVLQAALVLRDERIAQPVLVGREAAIRALAADNQVDLAGVRDRRPAGEPVARTNSPTCSSRSARRRA